MTDGISVGKDSDASFEIGYRIFSIAKTNIFVITKDDNIDIHEDACVCSYWVSVARSLVVEQYLPIEGDMVPIMRDRITPIR